MLKTICFATKGLVFNGNSLDTKSLGGSESAVIYMARELASLGNVVYVFCECDHPGIYDDVIYQDVTDFHDKIHFKFDVLIISRFLALHPKFQISNMTVFWMHDIYNDIYSDYVYLCDKTFLLSDYQKSLWLDVDARFNDIIEITRNGYDSYLANTCTIDSFLNKKNHYIYASRPERGLKTLLEFIWPQVLAINPKAILHICSYENNMTNKPEWYTQYISDIDVLLQESENIIMEGNLIKADYYKLLGSCGYMLYPTDFPEISCINAIEAQIMECLIITVPEYALLETVKSNTLTPIDNFVDLIYKYQDVDLYEKEIAFAKKAIYKYSWAIIAKEWDTYFNTYFKNRFLANKSGIIKQLQYNSDFLSIKAIDPNLCNELVSNTNKVNNTKIFSPAPLEVELSERLNSIIYILSNFIKDKSLTILDLGCGEGLIYNSLFYLCPNIKVIAYDNCIESLTSFKNRCKHIDRIHFINDSIFNLKNYKLNADIVVASEILEHIEDYNTLFKTIDIILNKDGMALFSTPYGPWSHYSIKDIKEDEHLNSFDLLDILHIFKYYIDNNAFILQSLRHNITYKGDILSNFIFGYMKLDAFYLNTLDLDYLKDKVTKTRPYQSISACLIVKNEENNLFRCLNSIKDKVDEIIIVDTGSNDRTKDICSYFTSNIYDYIWSFDFSAARNFAISKAKSDWILSIDADEEFIGENLQKYIYSSNISLFTIKQRQLDNACEQDQFPIRLFKNKKFYFKGCIHESILDNNDLKFFMDDVYLRHFGYLDNINIQLDKLRRNHNILLNDITLNPTREENFMYYMRDMLYFYTILKDNAFVNLAKDTWYFCKNKIHNVNIKKNTEEYFNNLITLYTKNNIIG